VRIGPAIDPAALSEQEINDQAERWINQTVAELERGARSRGPG